MAESRGSIEDAAQGGHTPALGGDSHCVDAIEPARLDAADDAATHEERGLRIDVPHLVGDLPDGAGKPQAHCRGECASQLDTLHAVVSSEASKAPSSRRYG